MKLQAGMQGGTGWLLGEQAQLLVGVAGGGSQKSGGFRRGSLAHPRGLWASSDHVWWSSGVSKGREPKGLCAK